MPDSPPPDGRTAKWILLLTLLFALIARLAAGQEPAAQRPIAELYRQAKQAAVEVLVDGHLAGTGCFVDAEGLLATAGHLLDRPGRKIEILSPVAGRIDAEVLAVDLGHDLIVLKVKPREGGYPALPPAEEFPPPGERIYLFGTPIFRHAVLLSGTVARDDTVFEYYTNRYVEMMHVAATVQGGTSGGPWLNRRGEVVGVQSGVMSQNSIPIGIANVSPVGALRALLESRRHAATPSVGMAVEELWQHNQEVLKRFPAGTEGLVVRARKKDGPADRAALKEWDLVVAAGGQKVRLSGELLRIVRSRKPGDELKLTVVGPDGTGTREVTLRLGKLEAAWPQPEK